MDDSYTIYRPNGSEVHSDSDSNDVINMSIDSSFDVRRRRTCEKTKETIIPDSDEGSADDSDQEDSSPAFRPKKKGGKRQILSDSETEEYSDYGDDNMTMSAATRLSIFGVKPPGANSDDDSDFIESDNEPVKESSPEVSIEDMAPNPHIGFYTSDHLEKVKGETCLDVSMSPSCRAGPKQLGKTRDSSPDVSIVETASNSHIGSFKKSNRSLANDSLEVGEIKNTDGERNDASYMEQDYSLKLVTSDESDAVVTLSSDDEMNVVPDKTPVLKKNSFGSDTSQPKISTFLKDNTYPNSGVVYVKKQIKENEMNKLNSLKVDLQKVNFLLETMNISTLPDKGVKLTQRGENLKIEIKRQAEKISNMIVEPDVITENHIKNDGFASWEDIKSGSAAVKPTKFGSTAISTHMAQRNMTLESLRALHVSLGTRPTEDTTSEPPRLLKTELMPHQLHALAWLVWRESQKPRGGILADDMGLGKTLTMISLILHGKEQNKDDTDDERDDDDDNEFKGKLASGGTLVVCPASLLKQWHGEITNHCKKHALKVEIHHGLKREASTYRLAQNDVVITTYNLVQRELEKCGTLMRIRWERVILDEAHTVRNHKSRTACAVFRLRSRVRWCLTGTPVHNKDLDLFALLKFLRCSPFDDIVLWKKWIDNKSSGGQERLAMIMKTLLLRRTKQQLQEQKSLGCLPEKSLHRINVSLSKEEMHVYQKVLVFSKTLFAQFLHQRAEKQSGGVVSFTQGANKPNEEYYRMHKKMAALHGAKPVKSHEILVLLLRLRQICCHAGLIHSMLDDEQYEGSALDRTDGTPAAEVDLLGELANLNLEAEEGRASADETQDSEGTSVAVAMSRVLRASNPVFNLKNASAKIKSVLKCLQENIFIHKNDKAVIVSQWTSMLDIVESNLKSMGIVCSTLSGKVPVTTRHEIVNQFNNPNSKIRVLLLSLCAGGVGLNLIGGNHLLLLDLHWNPQLEAQAQDRIYRVGQVKPVHIYKFMCVETVEQSIKTIQDKKLELADSVLTGAKMTQSSKLSIEDLKLMFNMT